MIKTIKSSPAEMFDIVRKAFTFEHSALIPHSLGLAIAIQDLAEKYVRQKVEVVEVFIGIFSEEVMRGLILTFLVFIAGLGMYIMVFTFDFITGLKASRKEHLISEGVATGYVKSDKLWSSVWKFFAVIVISFILTITSSILVLMDQTKLHQGGLLIMLFFFIMIISFDLHSIGENQERRFGYKPAFYDGMDRFFKFMGNIVMLRIKNIFIGDSDVLPPDFNAEPINNKDDDNGL